MLICIQQMFTEHLMLHKIMHRMNAFLVPDFALSSGSPVVNEIDTVPASKNLQTSERNIKQANPQIIIRLQILMNAFNKKTQHNNSVE